MTDEETQEESESDMESDERRRRSDGNPARDAVETGAEEDVIESRRSESRDVTALPQIGIERTPSMSVRSPFNEIPVSDRSGPMVPQIGSKEVISIDSYDLSAAQPALADEARYTVPQIEQDITYPISTRRLDTEEPTIANRLRRARLPQVEISPVSTPDTVASILDSGVAVSADTTDDDALRERSRRVDTVASMTAEASMEKSEQPASAQEWNGWAGLELPDPLELILGMDGDIRSNHPSVILVDDSDDIGVVETVVKRLHREKEGGDPDFVRFATAEKLVEEERWISADGRLFTAALSPEEWEELLDAEDGYQETWIRIWQTRVEQLFAGQRYGALIFNHDDVPAPKVTALSHHPARVFRVDSTVDWLDVAACFWNLDAADSDGVRTFSQIFHWGGNGLAELRRRRVLEAGDGTLRYAVDRDESASDMHYTLKLFVVEWLLEQQLGVPGPFQDCDSMTDIDDYRRIESVIRTEEPLTDTNDDETRGPTPDVKHGSEVFEAETFYGSGQRGGVEPTLQRTVRKYESWETFIDRINIVVDPLSCLLHLRTFARFERAHRPWQEENVDLAFWTVGKDGKGIRPLSEVAEALSELQDGLK